MYDGMSSGAILGTMAACSFFKDVKPPPIKPPSADEILSAFVVHDSSAEITNKNGPILTNAQENDDPL